MTLFVGAGGVSKQVNALYVGVGGAWKRVNGLWVGVGGVWKQVLAAFTVAPQSTSTSSDGGTASVGFFPDGSITDSNADSWTWGMPITPSVGSSFWIKFHRNSGFATGGSAMDTWLPLSTVRNVTLDPPLSGGRTSNLTYYIANAASDSNILGSNSIALFAVAL